MSEEQAVVETAPAEPAADAAPEQMAEQSQVESNTEAQSYSPEWFMADKYANVEEQARAAFELQKKMGKYWGGPKDDYDFDAMEGMDKDDPILNSMAPAIKEMSLSQDGFKHLVKSYEDATLAMAKQVEENLKKTLTTTDAMTYKACDKWMNENLTNEEIQHVQNNWLMTPEDFKMFNQMRLMAAPRSSVPSAADGQVAKFESSREVENDNILYKKEVKQGTRVRDKNYENELAQRFRDAKGREIRSSNR